MTPIWLFQSLSRHGNLVNLQANIQIPEQDAETRFEELNLGWEPILLGQKKLCCCEQIKYLMIC